MLSVGTTPASAPDRWSGLGMEMGSAPVGTGGSGQADAGPSDESLLRTCWRDQSALEALYTRHAGRARVVATRMLADAADAEDVVQDVFLTLWNRPHAFDPERGGARPWLFTVVRNRSRDHLRRPAPKDDVDALADRLEDASTPSAFDQFQASVRSQQVRTALQQLPDTQRALIHQAFFDGLSHQEIAQRTALPLGTVKSRIRLGLEKLRPLLAECA